MKKRLKIYILLAIIASCIVLFSNFETTIDFTSYRDDGVTTQGLTLKKHASNKVEWSFSSNREVNLLIIKKSTFDYLRRVVSELTFNTYKDVDEMLKGYLLDYYVAFETNQDSGTTFINTSGIYYIWFQTIGTISYSITIDPFFFDIMWIFYGLLAIILFFGILFTISTKLKLVKLKDNRNIVKLKVNNNNNIENSLPLREYSRSCETCGVTLEPQSIFCHECGVKLKQYK